eukprot:gene6995-7780_t
MRLISCLLLLLCLDGINGLSKIFVNECRKDALFKITDRDKKLGGVGANVISSTEQSLSNCLRSCIARQCRSFNYKAFDNAILNNCEVLNINKTSSGSSLVVASSWKHYEPIEQVSPRCRLVTCSAGYECVDRCSVDGYSCIDIDECLSSPCQNNATCSNLVNKYTCTCLPGYAGVNCEIEVNECESNPCQNGGTCNDLVNRFTCICQPGYSGNLCETNINECASNPCQNSGTCNDLVNKYTCTCQPGYSGTNCETDINECASSPCQNSGTCIDMVNKYTCTCQPGYSGTNCQTDINECASSPCQNSGTCIDMVNKYTCTCQPGYSGTNCQTNVNECSSSPCLNGGACTDKVNSYQCTCASGFTGSRCEVILFSKFCPTNWLSYDGYCYGYSFDLGISNTQVTWSQAKTECTQLGAHLAVMKSSGEQTSVFNFYNTVPRRDKSAYAYFIGLDKYLSGFRSVDGTTPTYFNWHSGEPNGGPDNEKCVEVYTSGSWNDLPCNLNRPFFCKQAGGAKGGRHSTNYGSYPGTFYGGLGATAQGDFGLSSGTVLNIVIGHRGGNSVEVKGGQSTTATAASLGLSLEDNAGTGGGGGTFVYTLSNSLYLAAGGGGGATAGRNGVYGQASTSGTAGLSAAGSAVGTGGTGGLAGQCCSTGSYHGGVGAGWASIGAGRAGSANGERGGSLSQGWVGGNAGGMNSGNNGGPAPGAVGGFGGGGGGSEDNGASGGGGGYSGGGAGGYSNMAGGGGGSYCGGSNCVKVTGGNTGSFGFVHITSMY